jgi:ribonuclease R
LFTQTKWRKYTFQLFWNNDKCEVVDQWFGRTVIYSDQRFAYEEAQYIIETRNTTEEISISGNSYVVSDEIVDAKNGSIS